MSLKMRKVSRFRRSRNSSNMFCIYIYIYIYIYELDDCFVNDSNNLNRIRRFCNI